MALYISYNGELINRDTFQISPENRVFRYGDGVFETIRLENGKILWAEKHYQRLKKSAGVLKMNFPAGFSLEQFTTELLRVYQKNHPDGGPARARLAMFRKEGGYYAPATNEVSFFIETVSLEKTGFYLNKKGLLIDIYPDTAKPVNRLSPLKSSNSLLFVLAGIFCKERKLDDCLIINEAGNFAEASSSNIFLVKGRELQTPSLDQGCVEGVMRSVILDIAHREGLPTREKKIDIADILQADELFLTNSIKGIAWVLGFRQKRFYHKTAHWLNGKLNQYARG